MEGVSIKDMISPDFYGLYHKINDKKFMHYWLNGGRGSCKSSFCGIMIPLHIVNHPDEHAICYRKVGNTLRESVYNQIIWGINELGLAEFFTWTVSPLEITYKPTGQKILFKGLDDPTKSKSIKLPFGYIGLAWFEELQEFAGMEEIRSVVQSVMRGGENFVGLYSYNPPQTLGNWVNAEASKDVDNRFVHQSNYLDVNPEWLGKNFIIEAELLKKHNRRAYDHEYMGIITGTGGTIFSNVVDKIIPDSQIKSFNNLRKGLDWGFAVDPFAYLNLHYDKTRRTIYIFDEIYKVGLLNDEAIELVKKKEIARELITADSAEPKSIAEFRQAGFNIQGAVKGKDSIRYGIKWLQKLHAIVIDKRRCPNAWKEFSLYEFEKLKTGEFKSTYPDKDNHLIDAARYAHERDMEKRGMF